MKTLRNIFLVMLLCFTFGCASMFVKWTPYPTFTELPPTTEVQIFNTKPDRDYVEIGTLKITLDNEAQVLKKATEKGKELGANGFIVLSREKRGELGLSITITGVLIRWKTE